MLQNAKKKYLTDKEIDKLSEKELNQRIGIYQKKIKQGKRIQNFRDFFPKKKVSYQKTIPVSEGLMRFSKNLKMLRKL